MRLRIVFCWAYFTLSGFISCGTFPSEFSSRRVIHRCIIEDPSVVRSSGTVDLGRT